MAGGEGPELVGPGGRLGPYRLSEEIGFGGMSRVFSAERVDDSFSKRVAVKVVEASLGGGEAISRRFRTERQILAALDHPSIARLYDGGETAKGQPYFVLEYVDGLPIDRHCRDNELGLRERVELMIEVCAAVSYAHQHLIVHRDLKPANILVTRQGSQDPSTGSSGFDKRSAVKLLDFGIAKVLEPDVFPHTVDATRTGQQPMTLHYASPEQIQGGTITTATDVYALGVILYQLMTGVRPYNLAGLPPRKVEEMICEREPALPSRAVAGEEVDHRPPGLKPAHLGG